MYIFYDSAPLLFFFLISYILLLIPLVLFIKLNFQNNKISFIDVMVTRFFLNKVILFVFFCLSGLPISNIFLLKWYCIVNISNLGNSMLLLIFLFINVCYILFYYFFFQKISISFSHKQSVSFIKPNSYLFTIYINFSLFFNIFGLFFINFFIHIF